jgi:hydrogenase-4 membrane subunit HyfE
MFGLFSQVFAQNQNDRLIRSTVPDIVGTVKNPLVYGDVTKGLVPFFTNIIRLMFVGAGIYAFLNFIIAGYQYMSAGGDTKALTAAWARIWQSLLGLIIIIGSFALAALFGYLIFGNAGFILKPVIYGPK